MISVSFSVFLTDHAYHCVAVDNWRHLHAANVGSHLIRYIHRVVYVQQIYIARSNDEKARSSRESRTQLAKLNEELQVAVQRADVATAQRQNFWRLQV